MDDDSPFGAAMRAFFWLIMATLFFLLGVVIVGVLSH